MCVRNWLQQVRAVTDARCYRYAQDFDSRYELKEKVGAGGFGTVYKVVSKLNGQECVTSLLCAIYIISA